jgi:hypothetical protein
MMDDPWCLQEERQLRWWAGPLEQRFTVSDPRIAFGDPTTIVRCETRVVRAVADLDSAAALIQELNTLTAVNAYILDADRRELKIVSSAYISDANLTWQRSMAVGALLQNIDAHAKAKALAKATHGEVSYSEHPVSGPRDKIDDLLLSMDLRFIPEGKKPSPFAGPACLMLKKLPRPPWLVVTTSPTGASGELPFEGAVPAALIGIATNSVETSLAQFGVGEHPHLGSGGIAVLKLGLNIDPAESGELARGLNTAEFIEPTGFPQFGAWVPDPKNNATLAHVTFLPSAMYDEGLLSTIAFYTSLRNEWSRQRLLSE